MDPERLTFQPPHALNPQEQAFRESLGPKEKQLHELATQMLGSSYFTGKTHAFTAWKAKQPNPNTSPPGAK